MYTSDLSEIVTYNPEFLCGDEPVETVARQLADLGVRRWLVVQQQELIGILTCGAVAKALRETAFVATGDLAPPGVATTLPIRELFTGASSARLELSDSPKKALRTMIDERAELLPVVSDGCLIATLSIADLLREYCHGSFGSSHDSVVEHLVKDLPAIDVDVSISQAADSFAEQECNYFRVVDQDFPVGVISLVEVETRMHQHRARCLINPSSPDEPEPTLADLVHEAPVIQPGSSMAAAAVRLSESNMRAIAVVNRGCRWLGAITEDSILRTMLYDQLSE